MGWSESWWQSEDDRAGVREFCWTGLDWTGLERIDGRGVEWRIYEGSGTTAVLGPWTVEERRRIDEMVIPVGSRRALRPSLDRCASSSCPIAGDGAAVNLVYQCTLHCRSQHYHVVAAAFAAFAAFSATSQKASPAPKQPGRVAYPMAAHTKLPVAVLCWRVSSTVSSLDVSRHPNSSSSTRLCGSLARPGNSMSTTRPWVGVAFVTGGSTDDIACNCRLACPSPRRHALPRMTAGPPMPVNPHGHVTRITTAKHASWCIDATKLLSMLGRRLTSSRNATHGQVCCPRSYIVHARKKCLETLAERSEHPRPPRGQMHASAAQDGCRCRQGAQATVTA